MTLMAPAPSPLKHHLTGVVFAAQACSCAGDHTGACTGDPCICGEPCTCEGAELYLGPRWRFVGDEIDAGTIQDVDVGRRIFLNFAQTPNEQARDWREVILIDDEASPEQVRVLLEMFQERQGSAVTHPQDRPARTRAAYLVPMRYQVVRGRPTLSVVHAPERSRLVHGTAAAPIQAWSFNGRVAVRGQLPQ